MDADQFTAALSALGLSQAGASNFLGLTDRQVRRYQRGHPIPAATVMLLRLMIEVGWTPEKAQALR